MTRISAHDLWNNGGNAVVSLPPTGADVLVVTTIAGRAAIVEPVHLFDAAVRRANAFCRRVRQGRPYAIKVLSLSVREAVAMGFVHASVLATEFNPARAERARQLMLSTLREVMRPCNDPQVRMDAFDLFNELENPR